MVLQYITELDLQRCSGVPLVALIESRHHQSGLLIAGGVRCARQRLGAPPGACDKAVLGLEFILACDSAQARTPGYIPGLMREVEDFQCHQAKLAIPGIDQPGLPVLQAPGLPAISIEQQHIADTRATLESLGTHAFERPQMRR
ncbi:hypothetical protein D3C80_1274810 [compost metagenome]